MAFEYRPYARMSNMALFTVVSAILAVHATHLPLAKMAQEFSDAVAEGIVFG